MELLVERWPNDAVICRQSSTGRGGGPRAPPAVRVWTQGVPAEWRQRASRRARHVIHPLEVILIRVVQTPSRAPNANAYAERFVRSIKEDCLNCTIPFGERHHRRATAEFVAHYHRERNHHGLDNELIDGQPAKGRVGRVRRHQRLGGLLNYYARAA